MPCLAGFASAYPYFVLDEKMCKSAAAAPHMLQMASPGVPSWQILCLAPWHSARHRGVDPDDRKASPGRNETGANISPGSQKRAGSPAELPKDACAPSLTGARVAHEIFNAMPIRDAATPRETCPTPRPDPRRRRTLPFPSPPPSTPRAHTRPRPSSAGHVVLASSYGGHSPRPPRFGAEVGGAERGRHEARS